MKKLCIAIAAIGLLPASAFAADQAVTPDRIPVTIKVSAQGLDLTTVQGQARLQRRFDYAVWSACNGSVYSTEAVRDDQCYQEMAANAQPQLQQMVQRANTQRTAQN